MVIKALSLLDAFTVETPSWGLRDLSREVGLSHTVVHRLLKSFEECGYIFQNPETKKYELGIKFIELSNVVEEKLQIYDWINPILEKVGSETGESVVLTILDNNEGAFVKIVESEKSIKFGESVGRRSPLYVGASHKVILAHLPQRLQDTIIDQGLEKQSEYIGSRESFSEKLQHIKNKGWFYTSGETYSDVAAISIPLFDRQEYVLGSLSVAGPAFRLTEEHATKMLPDLKESQREINKIFSKVIFPSRRDHLTM